MSRDTTVRRMAHEDGAGDDAANGVAMRRKLHAAVVEHLDLVRRSELGRLDAAELRAVAAESAREVLARGHFQLPDRASAEALIAAVVSETVGLGPLEALMHDPGVTEILVNGPGCIHIERAGRLERTDRVFSGGDALLAVIDRIVAAAGRRVDEGSPMVDARLADGSRANVVLPPVALDGAVLTIRRFPAQQPDLAALVEGGTMSGAMAVFLERCVRGRRNVVVSGGTGSGKTTMLNALSGCIPAGERIVTIEDAAELRLRQGHVVRLEARPPNSEGRGEVTIRDLVRNALRMRPDRLVIGECRGGEALDMLQAMNTGHEGSMTTAHANSPRDVLYRIEVMTLMAGMELPLRAIREQVASAIDVLVQMARCPDGRRRVVQICTVDGLEGDTLVVQEIFRYRARRAGQGRGTVEGFEGCGFAPSFWADLSAADGGCPDDAALFGEGAELTLLSGGGGHGCA